MSEENSSVEGQEPQPQAQPEQPAPPPPPMGSEQAPGTGGRPGPASDTSKILAGIGYIVPLVALITILIDPYKDEKFTRFHAIQAIGLWIAWVILGIGLGILGAIPIVGWLFGIMGFIVWLGVFVYAIVLAIQGFTGKYMEIPVVYGFIKGYVGE
jgi:uncharacterized membrane protein